MEHLLLFKGTIDGSHVFYNFIQHQCFPVYELLGKNWHFKETINLFPINLIRRESFILVNFNN